MILAGLGAEVIKVEPPGGSPTRMIGPFYQDQTHPERSLFFWQYNRGKRSVVLDLHCRQDQDTFRAMLSTADVWLDSTPNQELEEAGLDANALLQQLPTLIIARMTPFGNDGPWAHFKGSDLVHLALGGVMMNCGYDPEPGGRYDLPPIAPQMWHAYHIAGEQLVMGIAAALLYRWRTGRGQKVSCAIHEAVSKCTEVDLMTWVMRHASVMRQTCRHARETVSKLPSINHTKDGRWVLVHLGTVPGEGERLVSFLEGYGAAADLKRESASAQIGARSVPGTGRDNEELSHSMEVIQRFVRAYTYERVPWREAQEAGLLWAPLRKPLSECRLGLAASGGVYAVGQVAFHHKDDVSYREIPADVDTKDLRATHFAYDLSAARTDPNVVFPIDTLRRLVREGFLGGISSRLYAFMGGIYSSRRVSEDLAPRLTARFLEDGVDAVLLVPV